MITLYGFGEACGLPDLSPFVLKAATYLRMAGVEYRMVAGDNRRAPKRKLPYIDDDGQIIPDSSFIVEHIRRKYKDLDQGLSARDRAVATAFKAMLEEHFYFVSLVTRWKEERGWAVMNEVVRANLRRGGVPGIGIPLLAGFIRKQVVKTAEVQGTGRHSLAEIEAIGMQHCDALSEWLGEKPYFLDEHPRSIDATVFAFIWGMLDTPFESRVKEHMKSKANLVAYGKRMKEQYWKI